MNRSDMPNLVVWLALVTEKTDVELFDALHAHGSIRNYKPAAVSRSLVDEILQAGIRAS